MNWFSNALSRLIGFLPDFVAGLAILVVGYVIARVLARVVEPLLHRVGFDRLTARMGLVERAPETREGSRGAATAVFWVVLLVTLVQTARAWHLDSIANGLTRIVAYLPNVLGAVVIFGAALLFGNWTRDRMEAGGAQRAGAAVQHHGVAAGAVRAAIIAFGAFMALQELLIAPQIVTIAFTLTLGTIAVATALAFGLGSRSVAEEVARSWYETQNMAEPESRMVARQPPSVTGPLAAEQQPPAPPSHH